MEDGIEDEPHAALMKIASEFGKGLVAAKAAINLKVVSNVVPMSRGLLNGPEQQGFNTSSWR